MSERKKRGLGEFSESELVAELARRKAQACFHEGMTFQEMELVAEELKGDSGPPAVRAMLSRMSPEKPTAKHCPRCGKRVPVKAKDRERTVQSLSGPVTFKRNYHWCEGCRYGFYPVDALLGLPEEGELSPELEKRILDFAVNEPFGRCPERWKVHYSLPLSDNSFRLVADRMGKLCAEADGLYLQQELKPVTKPAKRLIVEADGSMLPMRGAEPWKEAKTGVLYDDDAHLSHRESSRGHISQARYVATTGGQEEFTQAMRMALAAELVKRAGLVVWVGDGAPWIWNMAQTLVPGCVEVLDWCHAVQHGMAFGKAALGEDSPLLPLWQDRLETLLVSADNDALVKELMECLPDLPDAAVGPLDDLIRYYRNNASRMRYRQLLEADLPIGSGAVESAHRHVLQGRMKLAGQHWAPARASRMARLRAAYRTAGPQRFHQAIRAAHRRSRFEPRPQRAKRKPYANLARAYRSM